MLPHHQPIRKLYMGPSHTLGCLPYLDFKKALLEPFREFGVCGAFFLLGWPAISLSARSQHMRSYPWQGHEGENLTGKVDQVFKDSEKASSRDPTHDKVMGRKPDGQGGSGFQGFRKAAPKLPPVLTLKMVSVLMLALINYSLISVT